MSAQKLESEVIYLSPETNFTRNELSLRHEKTPVYITFDCGQNKKKFLCLGW